MMFQGNLVALVTPFKNGKLDLEATRQLCQDMVTNGVYGIVVAGTTGEAPSLTDSEFESLIGTAIEATEKKLPIIAGAGTNSLRTTLKKVEIARRAGSSGLLVVTPYYVKPTPQGLYDHYKAVSKAAGPVPIILYNVPGRTAVNMTLQIVKKLLEFENITSLKEASGKLDQISRIILECGDRLSVLSGDDNLTLPILSVGGKGVISVVSNIAPREVTALFDAHMCGNPGRALELHQKLMPLVKACFIESNPIPVKTALSLMGKISPELRTPLAPMETKNLQQLKSVLADYGYI